MKEKIVETSGFVAEEPVTFDAPPVVVPFAKSKPEMKGIEEWRAELKTEAWKFAAAKMHAGWPAGREVTRAEYDAAIDGALSVTCR